MNRSQKSLFAAHAMLVYNGVVILPDKRILITGVRNRRSLAHAVAVSAKKQGAQLAFAVQPVDKAHDKTSAILSEDFPNAPIFPCDAGDDNAITNAVNGAAEALGGLDGLVHAIAFANRESISGGYHEGIDRAGFTLALDISAYTMTAFSKAALPHMKNGGGIVTLTYLGAERALPQL